MIWVTQDNQPPTEESPVHEMPWLRYFQGLERMENRKEHFTGKHIANMALWKRFNWQPEAAEFMLHWIATGSWDMGVVVVHS